MARLWEVLTLLLGILMAFSYQERRKTFIHVQETNAVETSVRKGLEYLTDAYNKKSEDMYNFRILRILKIEEQITGHTEFHISVEMQRTTCMKNETSNCDIQKGALYKRIQCYFSLYAVKQIEKYKILKKNCTDV